MALTLQQVFDKVNEQKDPRVGYVFDDPIHYIVLNDNDNTFDLEKIEQLIEAYDKAEKSTGPGVVVTVATSQKYFCTGFNLNWWAQNIKLNPLVGGARG